MKTLEYYSEDGSHIVFNDYTIDTNGNIVRKKTGKTLSRNKDGNYNRCTAQDIQGKRRSILIGRALASTFIGKPPTSKHTADHIDRDPNNDILYNIRWLCKKGQANNQSRPGILKSAFIIVRNDDEKTVKEWVEYLKDQKNHKGCEYTTKMITHYAQRKQFGFTYKEYPDLPDEVWKQVCGSDTNRGRWEISNMSRMKYITKHAENLFSGERLCLIKGYPSICFGKKIEYCHIITFKTFFPVEYSEKKKGEMILHENDDRLDFRPHKLRLGTASENVKDSYYNGKRVPLKSHK
jgi:hypothetical protein